MTEKKKFEQRLKENLDNFSAGMRMAFDFEVKK